MPNITAQQDSSQMAMALWSGLLSAVGGLDKLVS